MIKLLLLLFGALKFGKLLPSIATMLLSVAVYAWIFGWGFGVGFVALLLVHEMGHYLAARRRGLAVGAPTFIPFVGAWVELKDRPHDAETEAYVGLAGPLLGTVAALGCFYLARHLGSTLLLALAYSGFMLNLFNLIPLAPFDGGRITAAISPRLWLLGAPLLVALFFYAPSPLLILMALLALPHLVKAWRGLRTPEEQSYYTVPPESRLLYSAAYLGLAAFLAVMCQQLHAELPRLH
ncbi:MAG: site-2 protease family protein [Gammaproteobacteria bacterium]|nr:site-2 protease family protein [Gammaproteobacteria bacterium]MBV9621292.1 site-2 protease family protein [Gammaproteobacteria bacterium]